MLSIITVAVCFSNDNSTVARADAAAAAAAADDDEMWWLWRITQTVDGMPCRTALLSLIS
jgi:hypothetical protein